MTTIVIHGTLAKGSCWYWGSWGEGGFCRALALGMRDVSRRVDHDIWRVHGQDVSTVAGLQQGPWSIWHGIPKDLASVDGRFEWTGGPQGLDRGAAAIWLARYLNRVRTLTNERIRIIAHSHGCNVVKLASSHDELSPDVFIDRAVFLACPHFSEKAYRVEEPKNWTDKFDIGKQMPKECGRRFRYRVDPRRFGSILNVYSERDSVQVDLAEVWSGGPAPQTGQVLNDLWTMLKTADVYEQPEASRTDPDPDAAHLYENLAVKVAPDCSGIEAHGLMHGATIARFVGRWLDSDDGMAGVVRHFGDLPLVPRGDDGERGGSAKATPP
jgi:hypothetical protein